MKLLHTGLPNFHKQDRHTVSMMCGFICAYVKQNLLPLVFPLLFLKGGFIILRCENFTATCTNEINLLPLVSILLIESCISLMSVLCFSVI